MRKERFTALEIAEHLNSLGFKTRKKKRFNEAAIWSWAHHCREVGSCEVPKNPRNQHTTRKALKKKKARSIKTGPVGRLDIEVQLPSISEFQLPKGAKVSFADVLSEHF